MVAVVGSLQNPNPPRAQSAPESQQSRSGCRELHQTLQTGAAPLALIMYGAPEA